MSTKPPAGDRGAVDATHIDGHVGVAETLGTGPVKVDATFAGSSPPTSGSDRTLAVTPAPEAATGARTRPARPTALVAGMMVGEYKVETKLGEGGMGAVYGAVHPLIGKRAAIKVLKRELCSNPEAVERFVLEARSVNQIGHPNIVDIFSFGELADGSSYFVMEWLRGESLAQRLRRGRLAFGECLELLEGIIRGLEAAHEKGIIHRDLKPDNVYLVEVRGERPAVKLLDFGIAKLTGGEDNRLERTRTGALIGTPQYIAPEQARGYAIDHRADVYSLGVMAFEMFTGRPPFQAETAMDMISKHLNDPPPKPSTIVSLPFELDRVILEMLDKSPANRPGLTEIRELFEATRTASVNVALVGTVPDASVPAGVLKRRRTRTIELLACAVLFGGTATGVYLATRGGGSDAAPATPAPQPLAIVVDAGIAALPAPAPDAAPAVVAPRPTRLFVAFNVVPKVVTVDGVAHEPARDLQLDLLPGHHTIVASAPGHKRVQLDVILEEGKPLTRSIVLPPAKRSGTGKPKPGSDDEDDEDDEDGVANPFDKKKKKAP